MTHPDLNADFVEQVLAAAHRLLTAPDAPDEVTDLSIADDTGLQLTTVRVVLAEEEGKRITMRRSQDDSLHVLRAEPLDP